MSLDDDLLALAGHREDAYQSSLAQMVLDHPGTLRRQLRHYLAEQSNRGRLKKTYDHVPQLKTHSGNIQELVCEEVEFKSDAKLDFNIELEQQQTGWFVKRFKFDLRLSGRVIAMVRIHLNQERGRDALKVPRCHLHLGQSEAHIPFPIMSPRLVVHLICEHLEPDIGKTL